MEGEWSVSIEGEFCLRDRNGSEVSLSSRSLRTLIGLCALSDPMVQKRRDLAAWLWPGDSVESANTSLRQLLTLARKVLGSKCVAADREEVKLLGIQRFIGTGLIMPGFDQPPFCRARSLQTQEKIIPAAQAFCTAADYLAENSPQSLGEFLLASQPLLGLLPTTKSADLVTLALPQAQTNAERANLNFALGYFNCMASRLGLASQPLKSALDYAVKNGDLPLQAKVEEMQMHSAILTGAWDKAARLADRASPFARLVYFEHRGSHDFRRGLKGDFLRSGSLGPRQSAVAALFCITSYELDSWQLLTDRAHTSEPKTWDMLALLALGEGYKHLISSEFDKAITSFGKVVAEGEYGQSRDFIRYGLEGIMRVSRLTGEANNRSAESMRVAEIRQAMGLKVTAWDRARMTLCPL